MPMPDPAPSFPRGVPAAALHPSVRKTTDGRRRRGMRDVDPLSRKAAMTIRSASSAHHDGPGHRRFALGRDWTQEHSRQPSRSGKNMVVLWIILSAGYDGRHDQVAAWPHPRTRPRRRTHGGGCRAGDRRPHAEMHHEPDARQPDRALENGMLHDRLPGRFRCHHPAGAECRRWIGAGRSPQTQLGCRSPTRLTAQPDVRSASTSLTFQKAASLLSGHYSLTG